MAAKKKTISPEAARRMDARRDIVKAVSAQPMPVDYIARKAGVPAALAHDLLQELGRGGRVVGELSADGEATFRWVAADKGKVHARRLDPSTEFSPPTFCGEEPTWKTVPRDQKEREELKKRHARAATTLVLSEVTCAKCLARFARFPQARRCYQPAEALAS